MICVVLGCVLNLANRPFFAVRLTARLTGGPTRLTMHGLPAVTDDGDVLRFRGNTSHSDHFKLLEKDGNSLLIGARSVEMSDFKPGVSG